MSSRKRFPPSTALKARAQPHHTQSEVAKLRQCAEIFAFLPDGVIACDREGKIRQINAAALKLFEVSSERQCLGRDCQEFLRRYVL
ncbi:MAG: PAS domain-containing protein, partial [Ktedonobacteraceae bacterium]|nr:PAS domain-containing protein [Ktedonobacteraceae bacterium]